MKSLLTCVYGGVCVVQISTQVAEAAGDIAPPHSETTITVTANAPTAEAPELLSDKQLDQPILGPAKSLQQALDWVRQLRRAKAKDHAITINLPPARLRLDQAVIVGAEHSGTPKRPLVIRAIKRRATILTGAVQLRQVTGDRSDEALRPIPTSVRQRLQIFRLPEKLARQGSIAVERFHPLSAVPVPLELFASGRALRPARWPDAGFATIGKLPGGANGLRLELAGMPKGLLANAGDAWLSGYPSEPWSFESIPVGSKPHADGIQLKIRPRYGLEQGGRVFLEHAPSALDQPGEWLRLGEPGHVAVLAADNRAKPIEASLSDNLIIVRGAAHVRFDGLTLEHARSSALVVEDSRDIVFRNGTIRWTGGPGVRVAGGRGVGILTSVITDTGEDGVRLSGGNRHRLTPAGHFVADSVIRRFARLGRTYKPAVRLDGVGNAAAGNYIADAPHQAILYSGNDHYIQFNEITRVVQATSDSGAIYTGRDWTAQGTVIRGNYLHHIGPPLGRDESATVEPPDVKGIYLDDMASGMRVERNLFEAVPQAVFIGGGRDNTVRANFFVDSEPAIHIDARGTNWYRDGVHNPDRPLRKRLSGMPYRSGPWRQRYRQLADILADEPEQPKRNRISANLVAVQADGQAPLRLETGVDPERQSIESFHTISHASVVRRTRKGNGSADVEAPMSIAARLARGLHDAPEDLADALRKLRLPVGKMNRAEHLGELIALSDPVDRRPAGEETN